MDSTLSIILITLAVVFVIFLIIRDINCWYWKINERVNLQYKEVDGLKQILKELKEIKKLQQLNQRLNVSNDFLEGNLNETVGDGKNRKNDKDVDEFSLSNNEKQKVKEYIKSGLNPNEKLVINRYSREIKKIDEKDLDNINKKEWIVIKIK